MSTLRPVDIGTDKDLKELVEFDGIKKLHRKFYNVYGETQKKYGGSEEEKISSREEKRL